LADVVAVERHRLALHLLDAALDAWSQDRLVKLCELGQPLEQRCGCEQPLERLLLLALQLQVRLVLSQVYLNGFARTHLWFRLFACIFF